MAVDPDIEPLLAALEQRVLNRVDLLSVRVDEQARLVQQLGAADSALHSADKALERQLATAQADIAALMARVAELEDGGPVDPPPPTLPALDRTGSTIPNTDYAIPTGAIFVSPNGNNANPGTEASPKRTVFGTGGAYSALPAAGGTVVLRGGTYEEGTTSGGHWLSKTKPLTVQAYPGEQAWFDGSTVVAGWQGTGPWSAPWTFDAGNTSALTSDRPAQTYYFDQLFIDGVAQKRVTGAPGPGEFTVSAGTVTVGSNPLSKQVRVSRYRALAVADAKLNLLGVGVRRYANGAGGEGASTSGYSAIYYGGNSAGSTIEHCVFADHACLPINVAKSDFTINRNVFVRSGKSHAQIGGVTGGDRLRFTSNLCVQSNLGGWPAEPTAGAVKICKTDEGYVCDNTIEDAPGVHLLWFDQTCTRAKIARNTVISTPGRESKSGILWEISGGGVIDGTQFWSYIVANKVKGSCTYAGLSILGSNFTKVWCNTVEAARDMCVMVRQDNRPTGLAETAPTSYKYGRVDFLVHDIELVNNLIGPSSRYAQLAAWNSNGVHPPTANTMFSRLSGNWFADGNTNGASAVMWGETNQDSSRVNYKLVPTSAGAGALDSRSSFVANGWRNYQGGTVPATREQVPADVAALLP